MNYPKKALSFEAQAERLIERGLIADKDELIKRLSSVSYYRLSGYLYSFRRPGSKDYIEGTTLRVIWDRYCFDRGLRVLFLDVIERIEVSIRTQLTDHFAHEHGAFGHCDEHNFPNLKIADYPDWHLSDVEGKKILTNDRVGILLMICSAFLAQISPTSRWRERVEQLFNEYPEVPVKDMGLPGDWRKHPLWKL